MMILSRPKCFDKKIKFWELERQFEVKSTCCSYGVPKFSFQHSCGVGGGGSQPPVNSNSRGFKHPLLASEVDTQTLLPSHTYTYKYTHK